LEKELRELKAASPKAFAAAQEECQVVLRKTLGSRFDELTEGTRDRVLWAEFCYSHARSDHDFTDAVTWLTRAFEFEFRCRVIEPLFSELQAIAIRDSTFRGELSTFTLGGYLVLFQKYELKTGQLLDRLGLQHKNLCKAISKVNKEKDVKHLATKNKAQATDFRSLFLGDDSILNALFPSR
jgi:hypothetical protein